VRIFIILSILGTLLSAGSISGEGFGKSREEAKKSAISDLSMSIGSSVKSSFVSQKSQKSGDFQKSLHHRIEVETDYPILRPTFKLFRDGSEWKAVAKLDSSTSSESYRNRMRNIKNDILSTLKNSKNLKGDRAINSLNSVLEKIDEFQKYRTVSSEIGVRNIPILTVSKSDIESKLLKVEFDKKEDFIKVGRKGLKIEAKLSPKKEVYRIGDDVELSLKFTKRAYYYIVNHSIKEDGTNISYLVQLDYDKSGVEQFIGFIDKPNRWISLGSFEIENPIGSEFIEIFGKERSFKTKDFPKYSYNSDLDLYVLNSKPNKAIKRGRALRKKRKISVGKLYFKSN